MALRWSWGPNWSSGREGPFCGCGRDGQICSLNRAAGSGELTKKGEWIKPRIMKVVADERRRVTLPKPATPGDVFEVQTQSNGRFLLTKLEKAAAPKAKLVRRARLLLLSSAEPITWEQTRKAMDEFP